MSSVNRIACIRPLFLFLVLAAFHCSAVFANPHPNVVIIYGDDVGYGDVGAYGSKLIPTPNIDALASQSLRFTDGHCAAATCSPSRFSLLTGIHGFRRGVSILPPNAPLSIPTDILTLPKLFQRAGYETAVIGKWHLGIGAEGIPVDWNADVKPGPLEVGFDYSFLLPSTNDRVPCVYVENHRVINLDANDPLYVGTQKPDDNRSTIYPDGNVDREAMTFYQSTHGHSDSVINGIGRIGFMAGGQSALWNDETMADEFVNRAKAYLAARKDKPFFLYFSSQDIHVPRVPHPRFRGKTSLGFRGDAMAQFDWTTGQIVKALAENGLTDNTIVIFSSDNGPVYDDGYDDGTTVLRSTEEVDRGHDGSGDYRGGKYQIYEGGTRVPLLIRWPNRIQPGISHAMVNQIDFLASFATLLGIELSEQDAPDSRDALPAFLGDDPQGHEMMIEEAAGLALRRGPWKYIAPAKTNRKSNSNSNRNAGVQGQLFNLEVDISESDNLIGQHTEIAQSMSQQLQTWIDAARIR